MTSKASSKVHGLLTATDRQALLPLIYWHGHGGLTSAQEAEVRRLVASDYPEHARDLDCDRLMALARGIIGAAHFARALDAARSAA